MANQFPTHAPEPELHATPRGLLAETDGEVDFTLDSRCFPFLRSLLHAKQRYHHAKVDAENPVETGTGWHAGPRPAPSNHLARILLIQAPGHQSSTCSTAQWP